MSGTVIVTVAMLTGCDLTAPNSTAPPVIETLSVVPGSANVLSAQVVATISTADSASVEVALVGSSSAVATTPAVGMAGGNVRIPVLGLEPERHYEARIVAFGPGGVVRSDAQAFRTGPLPTDLPAFTIDGTDPSPGFVVFAAGNYGLVIDNGGRVVWYHHFPGGVGLNFMPQPNGRYVALPPSQSQWVEIAPSGEVTRTLGCARGLRPRLHDMLALPDGSYWLLCDETRTLDLTAVGGVSGAQVTGTVVQRLSAAKELLFEWSAFSHFDITDVDPALRGGATVNWTHGNALDLDASGNLIVSFRNLNEVTAIDVRTGSVLWRLGGRRNQFTLHGSTAAFAQQHSARARSRNEILLLDNVGDSTESRAELWAIDPVDRVARMVGSHGALPPVLTPIGGSVQPLAGGRTLVSFGVAARVEEYDASGNVVWRIQSGAGYVFRAQRIRSLYDPGEQLTR